MSSHNAVAMIKADHRRVEELYQRYQGLTGQTAERRAVVEQICHELEVHAKLEEDLFYPAVQSKLGKDATDLVDEAAKEHSEMKRLIRQLESSSAEDSQYDRTVHLLMSGVQHHVREEEGEMLPQAERRLGSELERLGVQMQERKQELLAAMPRAGRPGEGPLSQHKTTTDKAMGGSSTIEESIDVHIPVRTAYNQWTQFEEFPRFMEGVVEVRQLDDTHLHWKATIAGKEKEWDAVITEQLPDQRIAWTNTSGARNAGVVTFHRLSDNHTRVMLQLDYEPEGVVENVGDMIGVVSRRVRGDLERFKTFTESHGQETGAWRGTVEPRK